MPKMYKTERRLNEIEKLNRSARRKASRLKRVYGVDVNLDIRKIDDFETGTDYKDYVKELKKFTRYSEHRYVKLESDEVVAYDELLKLQKANIKRNKVNRERLAKSLKIIREETGQEIYLKDIDENPDLAFKLNVSSYLPVQTSISDIKGSYQYATSITRAKQQAKKVATKGYDKGIDKVHMDNFLKAIDTEWSSFKGSDKLKRYVRRKGASWLHREYLAGRIIPFEFVYKYENLEFRFHRTLENFGFKYLDYEDNNLTGEWLTPEEYEKVKNNKYRYKGRKMIRDQ